MTQYSIKGIEFGFRFNQRLEFILREKYFFKNTTKLYHTVKKASESSKLLADDAVYWCKFVVIYCKLSLQFDRSTTFTGNNVKIPTMTFYRTNLVDTISRRRLHHKVFQKSYNYMQFLTRFMVSSQELEIRTSSAHVLIELVAIFDPH